MKIIYLVHQFYPESHTGTEKFVLNMAKAMKTLGHQVKVITYSFYDDDFYTQKKGELLFKEFDFHDVPVIAFKYKKYPGDLYIYRTLAHEERGLMEVSMEILLTEQPDVIHCGHPLRLTPFLEAAQQLSVPYLVTLTDFFFFCPKGILINSAGHICSGSMQGEECRQSCKELAPQLTTERYQLANRILKSAHGVISPSRFVAEFFHKEFPGLQVEVIHHGLDYKYLRENDKSYSEDSQVVFGYTGSLNHHKGVHVLIDAFTRVKSPKARLKIFGSGHTPSYVNNLMKKARSDDRIEFCGVFQENQLADVFNSIDVSVVPSLWYENYPLALHESLACNVPVLASNVGGMLEKVKDGLNGFTFELGNRKAMQNVMENLVNNPQLLNQLKENLKKFPIPTVEQEALQYEQAYLQSVLGRR